LWTLIQSRIERFEIKILFFSYDVVSHKQKIQCLSLIDFRFQAKCQFEVLSFNQFTSIFCSIPNLQHFSCTLKSEMSQDKLVNSDYVNVEKWRHLCGEFRDLIDLDCSIKCPLRSTNCLETDFVRIMANISRTSDRLINIHLYHNNETNNNIKSDVSNHVFLSKQKDYPSLSLVCIRKSQNNLLNGVHRLKPITILQTDGKVLVDSVSDVNI
jgi:hypothetical protein